MKVHILQAQDDIFMDGIRKEFLIDFSVLRFWRRIGKIDEKEARQIADIYNIPANLKHSSHSLFTAV